MKEWHICAQPHFTPLVSVASSATNITQARIRTRCPQECFLHLWKLLDQPSIAPWDRKPCPCIRKYKQEGSGSYLVEETEAHILVRLLLCLLLLLFLGLLSSSSATGSTSSSTWGGSGATTRSNVQQEVLDILSFKSLSSQYQHRVHVFV
jgi:hypothetical protein